MLNLGSVKIYNLVVWFIFISSKEIVDHLIENSSTFAKKTDYSKEKYIKKKAKKFV